MTARLARVFLVVALLAGWQLALVHPLQHVAVDGSLVHLSDPHSGKSPAESSALCDALAALTACTSNSTPVLAFFPLAPQSVALPLFMAASRSGPPFFAQGPPALV